MSSRTPGVKIEDNRLRDVVVVDVSPAMELNIRLRKRGSVWIAHVAEDPTRWDTGTTIHQAVGSLMSLLAGDENYGIDIKVETS